MPITSVQKLKQAVVGGAIGAITIDTSTVEKHQYGFESGVLAKMTQFSRANVQHLVLDIVLHEMRSHLQAQSDLIKTQVMNALKPLGNSWGLTKEARAHALGLLFGEKTGGERTGERLDAFLDDSSAKVINCADFVQLSDVLKRYVETQPPFGNVEAKKREFPDAVALLALEAWAQRNNTSVLAVSGDSDWKRYCAESERVHYVEDLAQALSVFQAGADDAAELFRQLLDEGKLGSFEQEVLEELGRQPEKIDVDFEASSRWYFEAELGEVTLTAPEPLAAQAKEFDVLEFNDNVLVIKTSFKVDVTASFYVGFQHWDTIDREYVGMGSETFEQTERMAIDVVLNIAFADGSCTVESAELLPLSTVMEFGDIEPDFGGDGPEADVENFEPGEGVKL